MKKETIEDRIKKFGKSFRGLWTSCLFRDRYGKIIKKQEWSITFICDGDFVESPGFNTPQQALDYGLRMLTNHP